MPVPLVLRLLLALALLWTAASGTVANYTQAAKGLAVPLAERTTRLTAERLRAAAGPNADLLFAVRDACVPGVVHVVPLIAGNPADYAPEELFRLATQVGVIDLLRVLLFPHPILVRAPDPIAFAEQRAAHGRPTAYLRLPGHPSPGQPSSPRPDGCSWQNVHTSAAFDVWLCRRP